MFNTFKTSTFLKSMKMPIVCIFMFFPNDQIRCLNIKFKNGHSSKVKWSNLSMLVVIKSVKFIKESRQSVVKELLKDREESSDFKIEKNFSNFEIIRKETI